ncbi:MAG TPA: hypothetical protein VIL88_14820 [Devosia sp.]|jgi:hypothetical protein|uniref:hypothetical protein n=1 Tax=Devosia sp. TaxID=1871048 RepID=UPI002F9429E2
MATVAETVAAIAAATETKPGWVLHLARRLQEAGILPTGSASAPAAVHIEHVASLLLALLSGAQLKAAATAVHVYGDMRRCGVDVTIMPEAMRPPVTVARDYLEHVLHLFAAGSADDQRGLPQMQLEFVSNWPELTILFGKGEDPWRFVPAGELATHWRSGAIRKSTTITGAALREIVRRLNQTR